MSDQDPHASGHRLPRRFHFVTHLLCYLGIGGGLLALKLALGADWPLFWPLAAWATALAIHYFIASAYEVDSEWTEYRVLDLQTRSYDFDHIRSIERRIDERDDSVVPPPDRQPSKDGNGHDDRPPAPPPAGGRR